METRKKKVLLGMSGGLDSTFCAKILLERGYDVIGAAIIFSDCDSAEGAERAAREVGVDLITVDRREEFKKHVIDYFANTYLSAGTPNPCAMCNRYVKMETLFTLSEELGCDHFATGHYASSVKLENGRYAIKKGKDPKKDQSYMLWGMTERQIEKFIAPLEDLNKDDIRARALESGISSALSKESQDICFIKDGDYAAYIRNNYRDTPEGDFIDKNGKILGRHSGILNYTVGQRRGLDIALGYRAFVTDIDPEKNTVTLAPREELSADFFTVSDLNFQALEPCDKGEISALVKIRYSAKEAHVRAVIENGRASVFFSEPSTVPAPGQSAVFYSDDGVILFGGIIDRKMKK